jgi:hypothetical protein
MMPLQGQRLTDSELHVKKLQCELKSVNNEADANCVLVLQNLLEDSWRMKVRRGSYDCTD